MPGRCLGNWAAQSVPKPVDAPSAKTRETLTRFIDGVRSGKADLGDMTPEMAQAYGNGSPVEMPPKSHIPRPTSVRLLGADAHGNVVYAVGLAGGGLYWTININHEGRVEAAFLHFGNA
jgi:hypothetical protein